MLLIFVLSIKPYFLKLYFPNRALNCIKLSIKLSKSIKLYFLNSHVDEFPENLGPVSDEQGKVFIKILRHGTLL